MSRLGLWHLHETFSSLGNEKGLLIKADVLAHLERRWLGRKTAFWVARAFSSLLRRDRSYKLWIGAKGMHELKKELNSMEFK